MNWFQENKFLGSLITITLLLAAIIYYVGHIFASKVDDNVAQIDAKKASISKLERSVPFPNPENAEDKKQAVKKLLEDAEAARQKLLAFRPANAAEFDRKRDISAFTAHFDKVEKGLREYYEVKKITLPEEWHVGFEEYKSESADEANIGYLTYQMDAFDALFRDLADTGISAVLNFHRQKLSPELGEEWGAEDPVLGSNGKPLRQQPKRIYKSLPFELDIKGREGAIRKALNAIANSKEHFFITRALRIKNEKQTAPGLVDVSFDNVGAAGNAGNENEEGGGFANEFADPDADPVDGGDADQFAEPAANAPKIERILSIVAGDEELQCLIRGELILFEDEVTLPTVK